MTRAWAGRRRWLAPEVVQSSAMDCGPAALKCLLEGFHVRVSYGRLREACQTDVDGTSIDDLEEVANNLGVAAEQMLIPTDHVFLSGERHLPALVVVRHADGPTHFVVIWRRAGSWLQVMDPAVGRRWVRTTQLSRDLIRHSTSVAAAEWRAWAGSEDFLRPLRRQLAGIGASAKDIAQLTSAASADAGWFSMGVLDAATRLVRHVVDSGGIGAGRDAVRLLRALAQRTVDSSDDIFAIIPPRYWSVSPDAANTDTSHQRLVVSGAVLLQVSHRDGAVGASAGEDVPARPALSPELVAALNERPTRPIRALWTYLREDGLIGPAALLGAMAIATAATMVEGLLFRGVFDIGSVLALGSQRLLAALGLLSFMALALAFQVPVGVESLRLGRRLDARLRMALLRKLPHLADRYFQSRPISDLAERAHSIHLTRQVPGMGIHFLQAMWELLLTLAGVILLDRAGASLAVAIVVLALVIPAALQPTIAERDLRARNHAGALSRFYLDALLGLVPIRAHRAQAAVRHQHQSLLVEWVRSSRRTIRISLAAAAAQSLSCNALCAVLLVRHFVRAEGVTGADLLLVYWTLKLPALGHTLTALAHQYPMQRNILLRLLEPLAAPESVHAPAGNHLDARASAPAPRGESVAAPHIQILQGSVVVAGHSLLRNLDLSIARGEHVAIVGVSGAGKSSLVGILLGWHRLATGRLLVDGVELTDAAVAELRRTTAWVDPAVHIWNRPFLENLGYSSREPDARRTTAAIEAAHLRGVLQKLPQGLQTALGEGGALLSGGEGQRVRLARALAQPDVRLAVLDEPFRGLDRSLRGELLADVRRHWRDATLLCVTHDVAETRGFDRVLVVEDGAVIEDDHPSRLADRRSRYRELLHAEHRVRVRMWKGTFWRRFRVEGGAVDVTGAAYTELDAVGGQRY